MPKPLFIVIEGIDGSGKSTQIDLLEKAFHYHGHKAVITGEPTDGLIGSTIRQIMGGKLVTDPSVVAALYLADRLDHITHPDTGMLDVLKQGSHIIASRYYFSSYAFQGEYVPLKWLIDANNLCKEYLTADITFYINIEPSICYQRLISTRESLDIYENPKKLQRTHEEYLRAFEEAGEGENIVLLDGTLSPDNLHKEIWSHITRMIHS